MVKREHRQVFYGRNGTGKSELCRAIWIGMEPWRVVIDVKDDLGEKLPGIPTTSSPAEILHHPTIRIVPEEPDDALWFEEIYRIAFEAGECLLWCDELNEVTSPNKIPRAMRRYILQGRSRRCGHLGCTPRPADVHPTFGSQAQHIYVFRVTHPRDIEACAILLGMKPLELDQALDELPEFHYIHLDDTDEISINEPSHDPDELTAKISSKRFGASQIPERDPVVTQAER